LSGSNPTLFDLGVLPWTSPADPEKAEEVRIGRQWLLAALANSTLGTIEQRVAYILQRHLETRDDDVALAIRYWRKFEADVVLRWKTPDLEMLHDLTDFSSIERARRTIQNTLGLFVGTPRTRHLRDSLQLEFHRYMAEKQHDDPAIHIYLDETGNDPNERLTGVGGICVMDWRQFERFHAALSLSRQKLAFPAPLHFADIDGNKEPVYLSAIHQLSQKSPGLLLLAYVFPARRADKDRVMLNLYTQIVVEALRVMKNLNCLGTRRALYVMKEAEESFDHFSLPAMEQELSQQILKEFEGNVYLKTVQSIPKASDVLLEYADLIAGAVQRRERSDNRIHKDRVSDAMIRVAGFGGPSDGLVYQVHR
jgi:hypothetical protein